jgi:hypothetical protein
MDGRSLWCLGRWTVVLLTLSLTASVGLAAAEHSEGADAAIAAPESLEERQAQPGDLESRTVGAGDPDESTVEAGTIEGREARAEDPEASVAEAGRLEGRIAESESLSNLPPAAPDTGATSLEIPGQDDWRDTTDPEVVVARKRLVRAQARARAARDTYAEMLQRNYPRGEARLRIVHERDAAIAAFEQARRALEDAQN